MNERGWPRLPAARERDDASDAADALVQRSAEQPRSPWLRRRRLALRERKLCDAALLGAGRAPAPARLGSL